MNNGPRWMNLSEKRLLLISISLPHSIDGEFIGDTIALIWNGNRMVIIINSNGLSGRLFSRNALWCWWWNSCNSFKNRTTRISTSRATFSFIYVNLIFYEILNCFNRTNNWNLDLKCWNLLPQIDEFYNCQNSEIVICNHCFLSSM